eukprot:COSAG01_NODE_1637_length_9660_cov_7.731932_8_plen_81_part_00
MIHGAGMTAKKLGKRTWKHIAAHVLRNRADFQEEPSDLQLLLQSRGHILVMSVRIPLLFCHHAGCDCNHLPLTLAAKVPP